MVPLDWLSGSTFLVSSWHWVCPSVFPSRCYLLELSSLVSSWFWRVNSAIAATMDCTCWTEDGCMVGADWQSRRGLLEASLLSWGPGLVTLNLVQTISALCRWKELKNSRKIKFSKFLETSHRRRQLMMLHLSVGWTVFDVTNQRVASESWKMNSKVRGDRWRPTKNPPMAKLVSLWFLMSMKWKEVSECLPFSQIRAFIAHLQNNHLPSCKSTVSAETVITVFDTMSFGLIDLTIDGNDSHQFFRLRSELWCPKSKQ